MNKIYKRFATWCDKCDRAWVENGKKCPECGHRSKVKIRKPTSAEIINELRKESCMELNCKKETVFFVDHSHFEDFVINIYNCEYDFVAENEAYNGASYRFHVPNTNKRDFDLIRAGKNLRDTHALFNCLYEDGHLEAGIYVVEVYW